MERRKSRKKVVGINEKEKRKQSREEQYLFNCATLMQLIKSNFKSRFDVASKDPKKWLSSKMMKRSFDHLHLVFSVFSRWDPLGRAISWFHFKFPK